MGDITQFAVTPRGTGYPDYTVPTIVIDTLGSPINLKTTTKSPLGVEQPTAGVTATDVPQQVLDDKTALANDVIEAEFFNNGAETLFVRCISSNPVLANWVQILPYGSYNNTAQAALAWVVRADAGKTTAMTYRRTWVNAL